jgi:hypothetical protein
MNKVKIEGREYPCRMTMGAMMRFKQETGRGVEELKQGDSSDAVVLLWCCILSACAVDGVTFPYQALDMADRIDVEEFAKWSGDVFTSPGEVPGQPSGNGTKKK